MADAQRRLLDFARRSVAPFSLFRRTLCSLRIPHGTPPKREQHPLFPFRLRAIDGSEPCGETPLQARRLLRDFARDDCYIAAGSAACTARRLRPFPHACGGNGNTQNRNATAVSSLMAHIPHGVGQHTLSLFCWRSIDKSNLEVKYCFKRDGFYETSHERCASLWSALIMQGRVKWQKQKGAWAPFCA